MQMGYFVCLIVSGRRCASNRDTISAYFGEIRFLGSARLLITAWASFPKIHSKIIIRLISSGISFLVHCISKTSGQSQISGDDELTFKFSETGLCLVRLVLKATPMRFCELLMNNQIISEKVRFNEWNPKTENIIWAWIVFVIQLKTLKPRLNTGTEFFCMDHGSV